VYQALGSADAGSAEETTFMEIVRYPQREKGKWVRYPPGV
jgi:hypothetical protein